MKDYIRSVNEGVSQLKKSRHEPAMVAVLLIQFITVYGLIPTTSSRSPVLANIITTLPLLFSSLVFFITRVEWAVTIGAITFTLSAAIIVLDCFQQYPLVVIAECVVAIMTFLMLTIAILGTVFAPGRFSVYRALGSIAVYLNIGILFALIFRVIALLSVNAFSGLPQTSDHAGVRAALEYFSFTTLTSVGFGDILPVSPLARGFTMLEASIGHLYPATLLARIVSMATHAREDRNQE